MVTMSGPHYQRADLVARKLSAVPESGAIWRSSSYSIRQFEKMHHSCQEITVTGLVGITVDFSDVLSWGCADIGAVDRHRNDAGIAMYDLVHEIFS